MRSVLAHFSRPAERLLALIGPTLWWLVAFFALPLAIMGVISFAQRGEYGAIVWDWTKGNYERAFDPLYVQIYVRSVGLALATTVLCLLLGYPIAYTIALKAPERLRGVLLILVVIPFWTSFLVRTYAWILILRNDGLINSALAALKATGFAGWLEPPYALLYNDFAVLVGLVYGELPFMILPLYASIQKLDTSLLEAAQDLGATPAQAFWRVTVPLTRPGILAGTIFVFIPSIGMFVIPDLMGGSKSIMVGNLIQNQFTFTRDAPFGSAVCFLLTALVLAILFVNAWVAGEDEEGHP
jgi:spermidine/putrescine transport system permease protein